MFLAVRLGQTYQESSSPYIQPGALLGLTLFYLHASTHIVS